MGKNYRNRLFLSLLLLLPVFGQAQGVPQTGASASGWLRNSLERGFFENHSSKEVDPFKQVRWHYVFIFNNTQSSAKSAYAEFSRNLIRRFLEDRLAETDRSGARHLYSFYPYQLEVYGSDRSIQKATVDRKGIDLLDSIFPTTPFTFSGDGRTPLSRKGGHDNSGSRRKIMDTVGNPDQEMPVAVIQFTDTVVNEDPGNTKNDQRIRGISGRLGELESSGFTAYPADGLPLLTSPGTVGGEPTPVHVWTYGPKSFSNLQVIREKPQPQPEQENRIPLWLMPLSIGLLSLLLLGWYVRRLSLGGAKELTVTIEGEMPVVLEPNSKLFVVGRDATPPEPGSTISISSPNVPDASLFSLQHVGDGMKVQVLLGKVDILGIGGINLPVGDHEVVYVHGNFSKTFRISVKQTS